MKKKAEKSTKKQSELKENFVETTDVKSESIHEEKQNEKDFDFITPIEEVVEEINKDNKDPEKEFVKDYKELQKVEGYKQTDRGKFYYGVKK